MNSRKVILYSVNDGERGLLAFTLKHRLLLDVRQCLEWSHIDSQLRANHPDGEFGIRCFIYIHEGRSEDARQATAAILSTLKRDYPGLPVLLIDMPKVFDLSPADVRLSGIVTPLMLIETLKTLLARKRGPKKQSPARSAPDPKPKQAAEAPAIKCSDEVDVAAIKGKLRRGVPRTVIAQLLDVKLSAIDRIAAEMKPACASAA